MSKDKESSYYDKGGIEVLDVIKAKLTPEQYEGYLLGNAIKYNLRLNWKGTKERDAEKAKNYSKWYSQVVNKKAAPTDGSCWKGITEGELKDKANNVHISDEEWDNAYVKHINNLSKMFIGDAR